VAGRILWAQVVFEGSDGADLSLALLGEDAPDISVVDALARLQVVCRRSGMRVRLEQTCSMLQELLDLAGLGEVVGLGAENGFGAGSALTAEKGLGGEMVGEPERLEESFGIEERVDPRDVVT
jgi:hypothetical protein